MKKGLGKMKITIEIPDTTACMFLNYVFGTSSGMSMACKQISTDDIQIGEVIVCDTTKPRKDEEK